jgi:hypothetical protein
MPVMFHNGEVTFSYRDRKNHSQRKLMRLKTEEFIRRFLLHVIPKGLMRVRHLLNQTEELLALGFGGSILHILFILQVTRQRIVLPIVVPL